MKRRLSIASAVIVLGVFVLAVIPSVVSAKAGAGKSFANPSWNQTLSSNKRFIVLTNMNQEAVLDMETGLVWEKSPSTSTFTWYGAKSHCRVTTAGNRKGWRVPTIEEISSLVDPGQENPALPVGHPFGDIQMGEADYFWSSSTHIDATYTDGAIALMVRFDAGGTFFGEKSTSRHTWCVRGGYGYDAY